jgi:hypothetical protein
MIFSGTVIFTATLEELTLSAKGATGYETGLVHYFPGKTF